MTTAAYSVGERVRYVDEGDVWGTVSAVVDTYWGTRFVVDWDDGRGCDRQCPPEELARVPE